MQNSRQKAQTATPEELLSALSMASPSYIEGALANPGIKDDHIALILKNPLLTPTLIEKVCSMQQWIKPYRIKAAIVSHPKTPRRIALNFAKFLFWKDLLAVSDNMRLSPPLRRCAEELLKERVEEMALGEQITIARIGSRSIIKKLREKKDPKIIEALLQNPRTMEPDVVAIAKSVKTPTPVLSIIARHYTWGSRYQVRMALIGNRSTPVHDALKSLDGLVKKDLRAIRENKQLRKILRVAASRMLNGTP